MPDIRVSSWAELNDQLFEGSWNASLQRFRSSFAFRGLSDSGYDLRTSLMRLGGDYEKRERDLLRNFRKYAHRDAVPGDNVWNWLALAQHYGLPSRLLDWTFSPYVAMHFATENSERFDTDGAIWCVDFMGAHRLLPARLKRILAREGSTVFTVEMLHAAAATLQKFDGLGRKKFLVFFEPPSLDARIVNQSALFSLLSSPTALLDRWLAGHPALFHRVIIPASLKWEVRDKLDQSNITERVIFPGLDGLSRWLKRHYSPKT